MADLIVKAPERTWVQATQSEVDVWLPGTRNERGHVSCIQGCCDLCCPEPWYADLMEGEALDNEVMVSFLGDRLDRSIYLYGVPHNPLRRRRGPGAMSLELMDCARCGMTTAKGFPCENHG